MLKYEELTYQLRHFIFQARNDLQPGWPEEAYHQALLQLLQEANIPVISKPRKPIIHRGVAIHIFEADLLVWNLIILELKMLPELKKFTPAQHAQIIHYLRCWQKELGLLINFGTPQVNIKRIIWHDSPLVAREYYDSIKGCLNGNDRKYLLDIRRAVANIAKQYGIGYPVTLYKNALTAELTHQNIDCLPDAPVSCQFRGRTISSHHSGHLLVAEKYLVNILTLYIRPPTHEFLRTKTYLNALGLNFGLLVNFGKRQLQIYGINAHSE
ncbi:MAG TPA: GxxExxY protein [Chloroflexi bacterium]|nr:GxxExxY protein [Chloroflexota bacterium]